MSESDSTPKAPADPSPAPSSEPAVAASVSAEPAPVDGASAAAPPARPGGISSKPEIPPYTKETALAAAAKQASPATGKQPVIASSTGKQPVVASATGKQAIIDPNASRPSSRRRLMLELLSGCIEKSKVRDIVGMETVRFVLESSVAPKWRGQGDFELDAIWKILSKEPGLSQQEAALPLLIFSTYELDVEVKIKLPDELASVAFEERMLLREGLGFGADELEKAVERIQAVAAEEEAERDKAKILNQATSQSDAPLVPKKRKKGRTATIIGGVIASVIAIGLAIGAVLIILSDGTSAFPVDDVSDLLVLQNGRRVGPAMVAVVNDPRWDQLSKPDRKQLAHDLFERESPKGIEVMNLVDDTRRTLAYVSAPGGAAVTVTLP